MNKPNCFLAVELRIVGIAQNDVEQVADTCRSSGRSKPGVKLQGTVEQSDCLGQPFAGRKVILRHSTEIKIIGGEVLRSPPRRHCNFCLKHLWLNGRDNGDGYFVLKSKNVRQVMLKP